MVESVLFGKIEETKGDARINFEICRKLANYDNEIIETQHKEIYKHSQLYESDGAISLYEIIRAKNLMNYFMENLNKNGTVLVDALFGTGLSRPLMEELSNVIYHLNILNDTRINYFGHKRFLVSIDIPSGLNADISEQIGGNIRSDLTVTFTAPKIANVLPPASNYNGELSVANIGSPQELIDASPSKTFLYEKQDAKNWLEKTRFTSDSYKNKRGHALLIAGSNNYAGAAVLSGNSAIVSGVGLVTIATPESSQTAIASRILPEVMTRGVAETEHGAVAEDAFEEINEFIEKSIDAVAIGSGLSSSEESTRRLVRKIVEERKTPLVIDADGLNSLAPFDLEGNDELPLILTPHEGEFLKLLGTKDKEILNDRVKIVRDFAEKHKVILVLKGERVLTAAPDGRVVINPTGNSGLGKAGNGDTLTGIITGFIAQAVQRRVDIFETVCAAVYISSLAGDIAAEKFGKRVMLASDVRDCLGEAFRKVEGTSSS